jgi:hypothetical protein
MLELWVWLPLALAVPLAYAGMGAAVYGRLGITQEGDRFVGSRLAWAGYLGGISSVAAAIALLVTSVVVAIT